VDGAAVAMKKISFPVTISIVMAAAYVGIRIFSPQLLNDTASKYLIAVILAGFAIAIVRSASYILFDVIFLKRKGHEAPALLRLTLTLVLYALFFTLIITRVLNSGFGGMEILATSTVVSVIIGLALQDTLSNFFAGLSLHIEGTFHILDAIKVGDMLGRVEAVTWRTTTLRTNNNTVIVFPNSKMARESIEIYPFGNLNRRILRFPAPYSIPPQRVIKLAEQTVGSIANVATEKTPRVRIGDFSDSVITYEILFWVKDYMWIPDIEAEIREHLWYIYRRNDIEIPYPMRHILLEQVEGRRKPGEGDYRSVIDSVDIFEPLTEDERESIANSIVRHVYAPGELIFRKGDPGDSMFIINRGSVEVRLPGSNGNLQRVAVLERGDFFGEMALLTGEPRTADINAMTEVEILEVGKSAVRQLLGKNQGLAEALSLKLAQRQAELQEYKPESAEERTRARTVTILGRIQRFFGIA
jgi:small-conductance mechanosensitive channel/CRP-like cAMP-binding protein